MNSAASFEERKTRKKTPILVLFHVVWERVGSLTLVVLAVSRLLFSYVEHHQ